MKKALLLSMLIWLVSCSGGKEMAQHAYPSFSEEKNSEYESKIKNMVALAAGGDVLNLGDIVDYDWDKLYIFGENVSYAYINKTLGFSWLPEKDFYVAELTDLLVFMKGDDTVAGYIVVSGDIFSSTGANNMFSKDKALFSVLEVDDLVRPKVLIPSE